MPVKITVFDSEQDVKQYEITNSKQTLTVRVIDYGAIVTNILFADRNRKQLDLVLGYDTLAGYQRTDNPYFGATVGRVANRIANGTFELNSNKYQLDKNDGTSTLHGGLVGFNKNKWTVTGMTDTSVTMQLVSKDGDQHFPGDLKANITFGVSDDNEFKLEYSAQLLPDSRKDTIVNLTNHSYFNLNGCTDAQAILVLNHKVRMNCDHYLEVNSSLIPTGKDVSTKSVPVMDFSGKDFQLLADRVPKLIDGYDHCYVLSVDGQTSKVMQLAAEVQSPSTGIAMSVSTTEPSFQFYTGIHLNDSFTTKKTQTAEPIKLAKFAAVCLEGQRFPDAINEKQWQKQVILSPGQTYEQKTAYKFTVQ